jgi:hypothetical protein
LTLVAAFRLNGVAFMIGDFLITSAGSPTGARKKVQRLRSNVALGWSGHQIAAELVLSHLDRELGNIDVSGTSIESAFASFPRADLGTMQVELVGWLGDNLDLSFFWRSDWPAEVFWDSHHYIGSGATLFRKMAGAGSSDTGHDPIGTVGLALQYVARLLADEIGPRQNIAAGFGFAYEVLYWDGGGFRYVNDIAYGFAEVPFTSQGRLQDKRLIPTVYQYQISGECAVVDRISYRATQEGNVQHVERHLITPLVGDTAEEEARFLSGLAPPVKPLFEKAMFHCLMLVLIHGSEMRNPVFLTTLVGIGTGAAPAPRIDIVYGSNPGLQVALPSDEDIRIVYEDAMKDRSLDAPPHEAV